MNDDGVKAAYRRLAKIFHPDGKASNLFPVPSAKVVIVLVKWWIHL